MERPFTVLEKKLAELESQLTELLVGSPDDESPDGTACCRQSAFKEARPRIEFLKTLLAAEKECHPCEGPVHLAHIEERLAAVDGAFRKWVDCVVTPEVDFRELLVCSCTDACFSEEGMEEDDSVREEAECFVPPMSKDVEILELGGGERDERESEKEERKHWGFYCRHLGFLSIAAAAAAAAIGHIAMKFGSVEEDVFLVPT